MSSKKISKRNMALSFLMILLASLVIFAPASASQVPVSYPVTVLHNDAENRTTSGWIANGCWDAFNPWYGTYPLPGHSVWAGGWQCQVSISQLESPAIDLRHIVNANLAFSHYYSFNYSFTGNYPRDGGIIKVSKDGGNNWEQVVPAGGYSGVLTSENVLGPIPAYVGSSGRSWFAQRVDLPAYSGYSDVRIVFVIGTIGTPSNFAGWQIDDILISGTLVDYPPVIQSQTVSMRRDTSRKITPNASDQDIGDRLTFNITGYPTNGTVSLDTNFSNNGVFIYSPRHHFTGTDSVIVTVSDGILTRAATITIIVKPGRGR